jgi:hypothetical protein
MEGAELRPFLDLQERWSGIIGSLAAHAAERREYCRMRLHQCLSRVFCLSRGKRGLLEAGLRPFRRVRRDRLPGLINLYQCEAHREVVVQVLRESIERDRA